MEAQSHESKQHLVLEVGRAELIGASIAAGILGFLAGLALFYFKSGIREWGKLLGYSAGLGAFVGLIAYQRAGGKKQKRVAVDDSGLQIENEKDRVVLSWSEIDGVSHWVHGDHYWEFRTPNRSQPVVLKGFGFSVDQCKQLSSTIGRFKQITEEQPNLKRMLKDALVY